MSILVWVEQQDGQPLPSSLEVLGKAREIAAELNVSLHALVLGNAEAAQSVARFGPESVWVAEDALLATYRLDIYAQALAAAVEAVDATTVLTAATARGRDVCAAVAFDHDAGLAPDAVDLRVEAGRLVAVRAIYSNNILADVVFESPRAFVSIRPRSFALPQPTESSAAIRTLDFSAVDATRAEEVLESKTVGGGEINLADARIIVSGGRGVAKDPEKGFAMVDELAHVLNAAVGASRAAVDAGYVPYKHQVGQTGKTVRPDLYIAAGISGAIQHLAGMGGSKIIVAINQDGSAPIFERAHYGVVGDLYEILPALTEAFRKRLGD